MDDKYVVLVRQLELIASIKKDDTISVHYQCIIKRNSWNKLYQQYKYGETRSKTIDWIEKIIKETFHCLFLDDIDFSLFVKIKNLLQFISDKSLLNLSETYLEDDDFKKKIQNLQCQINKKLNPSPSQPIAIYKNILSLFPPKFHSL